MENLDLKCAELGQRLASINGKGVEEKVFTTALGVLEEQGPYACFLYLQAREGNVGKEIAKEAARSLQPLVAPSANAQDPLEFMRSLAADLDQLLFARDLLRQAFVYARYHVKAGDKGGGGRS